MSKAKTLAYEIAFHLGDISKDCIHVVEGETAFTITIESALVSDFLHLSSLFQVWDMQIIKAVYKNKTWKFEVLK